MVRWSYALNHVFVSKVLILCPGFCVIETMKFEGNLFRKIKFYEKNPSPNMRDRVIVITGF